MSIEWPTGAGARGNDGVADTIQQTPGTIGYLDQADAQQSKLAMASLQNRCGEYVRPSLESGGAGLALMELPEHLRVPVADRESQEKQSYPIVTYTWLLVHKTYDDRQIAAALKGVCKYALTDGQKRCAELGYLPLPPKVAERVLQQVESLGP
jgi:phosphate transport system substrate-binding protein